MSFVRVRSNWGRQEKPCQNSSSLPPLPGKLDSSMDLKKAFIDQEVSEETKEK